MKRLSEDAIIPQKATKGSAAYDVYLPKDTIIRCGRQVIPLDIAIAVPYGYEAKIEPRSGFSSKGMLDRNNERNDADVIVGKIDSDYRLGIGVIIVSRESYPFTLQKGTRVAQLTVYKVEDVDWEETDELDETERSGGFGSTGTN